ncbi:MAG: glutaconyl-CoA decarboxylase subunit alpha [Deltaproteobacteria bacterium]|nr:MAG: glutaconyl-CoA decarboxylase subunit alpha [Deltaproteobacteria bacterium]
MKSYFREMPSFGAPLTERQKSDAAESVASIKEVESVLLEAREKVRKAGLPEEKLNKRGELTVFQRLDYLVDPGTWCELNSLLNPMDNKEGTTSIVNGLGRISGRWCVIIGFDNKVLAGAWVAGQAENVLRATDMSKRLNIPLVWLVNCSGIKLPDQHLSYAGRRSGGATFFRHAELQQMGVPVLAAVYGTNPAGGGYHSISPSLIVAHEDANMAVGGAGIVSGMKPKGFFDLEGAEGLIEATKKFKASPPGAVPVHRDVTGFFRFTSKTEHGVLDIIKDHVRGMPAYDPEFFRVDIPKPPKFDTAELNSIVPFNQKRTYNFRDVVARLVDGSEHHEYRPDYGPEIYCGLVKIDGFPVGVIGNNQGFLGAEYPKYAEYMGIGGKLYREGLIKMSEFVTFCGRDKLPIIWIQDTTGIDVGDDAEKAELLGVGQSLIYSIEQTEIPHMLVVLRKGSAAAHYVMGGPQGNNHNSFTLGVPTTEVYVMHGETAAAATFARRLVKERNAGNPLEPVIEKMNAMVEEYYDNSRPLYCAKHGLVDEIVAFDDLRKYLAAFTGAAYQNPKALCAHHQMLLPRVIRG